MMVVMSDMKRRKASPDANLKSSMATRKPQKRAPGVQYPSESYAARAERGKKPSLYSLTDDARARVQELADMSKQPKSAVVEGLIMSTTETGYVVREPESDCHGFHDMVACMPWPGIRRVEQCRNCKIEIVWRDFMPRVESIPRQPGQPSKCICKILLEGGKPTPFRHPRCPFLHRVKTPRS
jgi:hypothetical protein